MPSEGNDNTNHLPQPSDVALALGLLTRLPVPQWMTPPPGKRPAALAAWAYPLVGVVVAGFAATLGAAANGMGLPAPVVAGVILSAMIVVTGALHEDGLADCVDGFWGGWTQARRLEIMKDSHIGTYGVLALVLSTLLRWTLITGLVQTETLFWPLVAAAVVSRGAMVGVMAALPNARSGGLSSQTGRPARLTTSLALGIAAVIAFAAPGLSGWVVLSVAALTALTVALLARAKIGGQTGDVLGATQQVTEIAVLCACVVA